ncbi:FAD-dependent oxidoreductase [Mariniblastus fucicola]|uniref:FAD dependent oxidoreductase n=1 Tax=Mariniblastus fucicola TaxID=980251 RepID=A0A5B9PCH2_9BACT|nr:FAD-dependent oxidoreductase [Mariniblastus fucicola]QEG24437.1 FAD dependent oxidoreductase [Mariniblastus fucicola]
MVKLLLALFSILSAPEQENSADVVIYGGTSAGVVAAVQARRMGKTAIIVEPTSHLGGLSSNGLGWTDSGNKNAIGGISREFYQRIQTHYNNPASWHHVDRAKYDRYRPNADAMWTFEPKVAESIFESFVSENGILVFKNERLDRGATGVSKTGGRITSFRTTSGKIFRGKMFVDATYEGDLLAAAGVSFTIGREGNDVYDETLNGVQKTRMRHHLFTAKVDPYVVPGDPASGLVWGVHNNPPGKDGEGDNRLQAYCYRMCMSNVPANSTPFPKPDGYDESQFELLFRNFEAGDLRFPLKPDMMPNGKTDTNNNCAFSTDAIGLNYDFPAASYAEREKILAEHERYQKGLMWTLANHERVPESIRSSMSKWGLAADEFTDNENWPYQIYVREGRRMISDYVQTEKDCRRIRIADDSVGLGSYNMDSHNVQRYVTPEGFVQNEGDVQESPGGAYAISYKAIVPKRDEIQNLFVPVCLSSSHIAYGSIRMEPVFMVLGQSAATAAALAIDSNQSVQDVPYDKLRERLLADKQALDIPEGSSAMIRIRKSKLDGIVVDDDEATFVGAWSKSSAVGPFIESGYHHDGNLDHGEKKAIFATTLEPGEYDILLAYTPNKNRATKVSVQLNGGDFSEQADATVNMRIKPDQPNGFVRIGSCKVIAPEQKTELVVSNKGADGYVVVDAVQFIKK